MTLREGIPNTKCDPPCVPRAMLGRSWWKCLGFNTPCECAHYHHYRGRRYRSDYMDVDALE